VDAGNGLLGILRVGFVFRFAVFLGDGQDAQSGDGFERIDGFCVEHADADGKVVANVDEHQK